MDQKTASRLTWIFLILMPLLPSYMVLAATRFNIFGMIIIGIIEYFGFMYVIALLIRRIFTRIQEKQKQKNMEMVQE